MENIVKVGERVVRSARIFANYPEWVLIREQKTHLAEQLNQNPLEKRDITRRQIAEVLLERSAAVRGASQQNVRHFAEEWDALNTNVLLSGAMRQGQLPRLRFLNSQYSGLFTKFQQEGTMCIAEVIAGCLDPYDIKVDYKDLYNKQGEYAERLGIANDLTTYVEVLKDFGIETRMIDNPNSFFAFLLCGYPIVGVNPSKWHAYAAVGHLIDFEWGGDIKSKVDINFDSTTPYQPEAHRLEEVPSNFINHGWIVLNPIVSKDKQAVSEVPPQR